MEDGNLKIVFSEILRGYTLVSLPSFGNVKIKHFNNFDSAELDIKNRFFYDKAVSQGLPTRKERIDHLLDEDIWTEEKNKEILNLKSLIAGLRNSKSKVFLQAHIDQINNDLKKSQGELSTLSLKKEELIGFCAEAYAARRINEHYMHNAFLKENGEKLFTSEEFEELEEGKLVDLIGTYNKSTKKFDSNSLKKLSVSAFFTNLFYLCENNAYSFFGKPLVQLTFYQIEVFGYGRYYKSLLENSNTKPPDEITSDPEKMVEWFESSKSAAETLEKSKVAGQDGSAQSLVGATTQDLKRLGLDNPDETINLAKKAAEKGGRLDMEDMMKLHGVS
jgi:hypothetical protein|tara:strand:- start:1595 stop:2593 length:999 start_codon:yes stop_codon:yes gene_type:complete